MRHSNKVFKFGKILQKSLYLYIVGNQEEKGTKSG